MPLPRSILVLSVSVLALAACGGGETTAEGDAVSVPTAQPTEEVSAPAAAPGSDSSPGADDQGDDGVAAGGTGPARPAQGSCTDLPESPDGSYTVADAGTVVVTREGDRLVLGPVGPAEGWTHVVDDQEQDEIEIEFRRGAEELDFEIEIDDGRLEVKICADDD